MTKIWGHLYPETPFKRIFPDGKVPLKGVLDYQPRLDWPNCYICDGRALSSDQVKQLALLIQEKWPEFSLFEIQFEITHKGLPLDTKWFSGVSTNILWFI